MSEKYNKVKEYYDKGLWKKSAVKNAVIKFWITSTEYKEITGEEFGGDEE